MNTPVSEPDEELELQALERQLDDAFQTTRPRQGFQDELWARMQVKRPFWSRVRTAVRRLGAAPVIPLAAVATVLVVVIGVGLMTLGGTNRSEATQASRAGSAPDLHAGGSFGQVPAPQLGTKGPVQPVTGPADVNPLPPPGGSYAGPVSLTWTGSFKQSIGTAPVYRYREPSAATADQFAATLGAVLQARTDGFLGTYETSDYTLRVRGTVQAPPSAPAYFILSAPSMPSISAAGAAPGDIAALFLAEHNLSPQWPYTVAVDGSGDLLKVRFLRQFSTPGYGLANLVDGNGLPYGLEVDFSGTEAVLASGPLPLPLDSASYPLITFDQAASAAVASSPAPAGPAALPKVALTSATLVYVLVPAGGQSFYEPAFLFSGSFKVNGVTFEKRVLVPALDPTRQP